MKKTLLILGLVTLFSCNRENENLGITEQPYSSSKNISSRSGDVGAGPNADFLPNNLPCEISERISSIPGLPSPITDPNTKVRTTYAPSSFLGVISLPELIVNYLNSRGITVQQILFNNNTPPAGSYFENNFYKEFTFTDGKTIVPDEYGNIGKFIVFPFDDYMDNDIASDVVKNAYSKIIKNMPLNARNSIKAIRIFYQNDYICSDWEEERRNLKIQVIYKLNYATHTPMLEP